MNVIKTEMDLIYAVMKMEDLGLRIDTDHLNKAKSLAEKRAAENKKILDGYVEEGEFKDSGKTLKGIFDKRGWKYATTLKGNPSFTGDNLKKFKCPEEIYTPLVTWRKMRKLIDSYYNKLLEVVDEDGVVHPSYFQTGAVTGRFSAKNPAVQTLPNPDEDTSDEDMAVANEVRGCIIPRDGMLFLAIDYSQQEYRLLLDYLGDKELIDIMNAGGDFHAETAKIVGIERRYAKNLNFAYLYGAGNRVLAQMADITVKDARELRKTYESKLPALPKFINAVEDTARRKGYVRNWAGRVLRVDTYTRKNAVNYIIQSGGADIIKRAMVEIHKFLYNGPVEAQTYMVCQIHDELLFEVPKTGWGRLTIPEIIKIMEKVYPPMNGCRMVVDASQGTSFSKFDMLPYKGES